jgi:hypothetical protein
VGQAKVIEKTLQGGVLGIVPFGEAKGFELYDVIVSGQRVIYKFVPEVL